MGEREQLHIGGGKSAGIADEGGGVLHGAAICWPTTLLASLRASAGWGEIRLHLQPADFVGEFLALGGGEFGGSDGEC